MAKAQLEPEREERISMEIIADCYNEEDQAMGWYYYLEENLQFPFTARCIVKRPISPLRANEKVQVLEMAPQEECEHDMFVIVQWKEDELGVALWQLQPVGADEETVQAVEDWHYWINQGRQL